MYSTKLRKVGGSIMMTVPPTILESLALEAGEAVSLTIEEGKIVATPLRRPTYRLAELVAQYDVGEMESDSEWDQMPPTGAEIL